MRSTAIIALALAAFSTPVISAPFQAAYCATHPTDCARALVSRQVARDVVRLRPVHLGARSSADVERRDLQELLERALDDESGAINWGPIVKAGSGILSGLSIGSTIASLFPHGNSDSSSRRDYDESGAMKFDPWRADRWRTTLPPNRQYMIARAEGADELLARDDIVALLARDLESGAINWGPIVQTAKKYLPHILGAGAGLLPALIPHGGDSGNQTRRSYEELLVRALEDESGAVNFKPFIEAAKNWGPKILSWGATAVPVVSALIPHGGNSGNTTQTRRDFGELLARFNEQQERREAFERIARDVVVESFLGRRALTDVDLD